MKTNTYISIKLIIAFCASICSFNAMGQEEPLNCDYYAYLFQYNDVYAIDLASGNSVLVAEDITTGNINATGFNPTDGFIWGSLTSPAKSIVRIDKNFNTTTLYVEGLPTNNRYIGDINMNGVYFLKGGGSTFYKVDLHPESSTYGELIASATLSKGISIHDWAFNAVDNKLYAVEKGSNILYRINPETGEVQQLGVVPILSGLNYTYGAVYFDADGRFYVSANQTGTIYVIQDVQNVTENSSISSNLFAFGPSSASNDGARCPTATVAQEICDNGIDDDGDGLVDCEDPSCSSYGNCNTSFAEASSANNGGLESTNRLSNAIAKRNFNRAKSGYSFNRALAPLVEKSTQYSRRVTDPDQLEQYIPLEIIDEDYVVESSPEDLVNITNASSVYAVDYIHNDAATASILVLKTENGVYEHTKYICDRLLGAELLSVSTIEINEQQFIKSLIRNMDGSVEFVMSLSAKIVDDNTAFAIESHWNLDKYEDNATFYNFQIWANSIDDLYSLGAEVLNLLEVQKPVVSYELSTPPTVFVKKGAYNNGSLKLEVINTNGTDEVTFDAGIRKTETSPVQNTTSTINLENSYNTQVTIDTGTLFDTGFRIGDGIHTPDDLFLSDGPWGIDASQESSTVEFYEIAENTNDFDQDAYPIERNLSLKATTSSYIGAYRALTPRFQEVDLSNYNTFTFSGSGTGELEVTLVKKSIEKWEEQFKTTVNLHEEMQTFDLAMTDFNSSTNTELQLNDVVTIVFTMTSKDGTSQQKEVQINDIYFSNKEALNVDSIETSSTTTVNYPNPFASQTTIAVGQKLNSVHIRVVDMLGRIVDEQQLEMGGETQVQFIARSLQNGVYAYVLTDNKSRHYYGKFVIQK